MAAESQDLTWMPAWRIRDLVAKREVSALEVTDHFLGRIEALDPKLHMFRKVDPAAAREQARAADKALADGAPAGPLHGVPIGLKEHIAVRGLPFLKMGGLETGAAAAFPIAEEDSIVAERLRRAGAIIVGVTIMPGMGIGPGMPDLANHPRNPWDPARAPGSSSAGSAAAVASGALPVAIGSDGGGSTRLPAALTGVIGVHPTIGRLPNASYDNPHLMMTVTFGPMTRDARDAAIIMQATSGPDGRDMLSSVHGPAPDYVKDIDKGAQGMRLAWTDDFGFAGQYAVPQTPQVIAAVRTAAQGVKALGASLTPLNERWESFWPHYLTMDAAFGSNRKAKLPEPAALKEASEVRARNRAKFDAVLREHDVLMSPTIQFTARTVEEWNTSWREVLKFSPVYTSNTFMFNWLGLPAISVPVGFIDGLPVGLQLIGQPDSEPKLLRLAQAILKRYPRNERPSLA